MAEEEGGTGRVQAPDPSPIQNRFKILNTKLGNIVAHLKTCFHKEWDSSNWNKILTEKLQNIFKALWEGS